MRRNLADPQYEPSDDDLHELARTAFAHVPQARREADARLRADIATRREEVLRRVRHTTPACVVNSTLFVIAGPHGAGKTTLRVGDCFARRGLEPGSETVLLGLEDLSILESARAAGRALHVAFISTGDPRICAARVMNRVMRGGLSVPVEEIVSGYAKSMTSLSGAIVLAQRVDLFDNSADGQPPFHCARTEEGKLQAIYSSKSWVADAIDGLEKHPAFVDLREE